MSAFDSFQTQMWGSQESGLRRYLQRTVVAQLASSATEHSVACDCCQLTIPYTQQTSSALTTLPRGSVQAADWCLSCPAVTRIYPQLQVQEAAPCGRGWSILRQSFKRHAAADLQAAATHGHQPASRAEASIAPMLLKSFARARVRVALKAHFADDPVQGSPEKQLALCSVQQAAVPAEGSALLQGASQESASEGSMEAVLGVPMAAPDDRDEVQRAVQPAAMQPSKTATTAAISATASSMSGATQTQVSTRWC